MSIVTLVTVICNVLIGAIFIRALLSFFTNDPRNPIVNVLDQVTEPLLSPLRRIVPRVGMFDLTPLVAIIILYVIQILVASYYNG